MILFFYFQVVHLRSWFIGERELPSKLKPKYKNLVKIEYFLENKQNLNYLVKSSQLYVHIVQYLVLIRVFLYVASSIVHVMVIVRDTTQR